MIGDKQVTSNFGKQVISNFKSQYMQESNILSKHAAHIKLCLLNPMHIK